MNSNKIELGAVNYLEELVFHHTLLHSHINKNDKEPSWDGFIYVYEDASFSNDKLEYTLNGHCRKLRLVFK